MSRYVPPNSRTYDRAPGTGGAPQLDAAQVAAHLPPTAKAPPEPRSEGRTAGDESLTPRDRAILVRLAQLRLLSYAQIHAEFFAGASIEATGQRMRHLARQDWVRLWKEPVVRGGRPVWALPTARGLRIGLDTAIAAVTNPKVRRLIRTMLPAGRRRPLDLAPGVRPPYLSHQREVNTLATDFAAAWHSSLLWTSAWDRPFRSRAAGLSLPQPDLVLVINHGDAPRLIFLEHDRGQESLRHFASAKVDHYAELAARPDLLERLTGFRDFRVAVTVIDARFHRPVARLRHLAAECVRLGADHLFRFTLAGWAHAAIRGKIWLVPDTASEDIARIGKAAGGPAGELLEIRSLSE